MTDRGLDSRQLRAAALLAQGRLVKEAAAEVGVSPKTVTRWSKDEDFRAAVRRQREALLGDDVPDAEAVLVSALGAVRKDGSPAWEHRIAAAKALLNTPVASSEAQAQARETTLYVLPDETQEEAAAS